MPRRHLLLIPGLNCTAELFSAQISALEDLAEITIGAHGLDDSMPAIAARILAAAPPRFALAGLSMGGYIAFEILRQAADRVERVMLLSTNARADSEEQRAVRREMIVLAEEGKFDRVAAMQWPRMVSPARLDDAALREVFHRMARDTGADAFIRQQRAILARVDSRPELQAIRCPVTIIVGEDDVITPPALAEEMAAGIAGARLIRIPKCGHLSALEAGDAVAQAMRGWLTS